MATSWTSRPLPPTRATGDTSPAADMNLVVAALTHARAAVNGAEEALVGKADASAVAEALAAKADAAALNAKADASAVTAALAGKADAILERDSLAAAQADASIPEGAFVWLKSV